MKSLKTVYRELLLQDGTLFDRIHNQPNDGIWILDSGVPGFAWISPSFYGVSGLAVPEHPETGREWKDVLSPRSTQLLAGLIQSGKENKEPLLVHVVSAQKVQRMQVSMLCSMFDGCNIVLLLWRRPAPEKSESGARQLFLSSELNAGDFLFVLDSSLCFVDFSSSGTDVPYDPSLGFLGQPFTTVPFPEQARQTLLHALRYTLDSGKRSFVTYETIKNGKPEHYNADIIRVDDAGTAELWVLVQNRTGQQQRENRELQTRNRLETLLRQFPDYKFLLDKEGRYIDVIAPDPSRLIAPPEQLIGKPLDAFFDPELAALANGVFQRVLQTGNIESFPYSLTLQGRLCHFEAKLIPLVHEQQVLILVKDTTEEMHFKEELELLALVSAKTTDAIRVADAHGKTVWVNPAYERLTGYSLEELKLKEPNDLLHGAETDSATSSRVDNAVKAGLPVREEILNYRKDGSTYWIDLKIDPVLDQHGNVFRYIAIARDISDRKQAEQTLQEKETRFRSLVNSFPDIIYTLDTSCRHTGVYGDWVSVPGSNALSMLGKTALEILGEDAGKVHMDANSRALRGEKTTYEWSAGTGAETQYYQTVLTPVTNPDGAVTGLIGVGRNMTALKQAEQALKERESYYRQILDSVQEIIFCKTPDSNLVYVNRAMEEFYGLPANALINTLDGGRDASDTLKTYVQDDRKVFESGRMLEIHEEPIIGKNGETRIFHTIKTPILDTSGRIIQLVGVSRDITSRKRAEQQLTRSEARFRGLIESQTSYVLRTDLQGDIAYHNQKYQEDFGWIKDEQGNMHRSGMAAIMPYHHQLVRDTVQKCLQEPGRAFQVEMDKPARHGGCLTTLWDFVCIPDMDGNPHEIQAVGVNITGRVVAEKALRRKDELLEAVADATAKLIQFDHYVDALSASAATICTAAQADRIYLFEWHPYSDGEQRISQRFEWTVDHVQPQINNPDLQNIPFSQFAELFESMRNGFVLNTPVSVLKPPFSDHLRSQQVSAILAIPLVLEGSFFGFIGLDNCHSEHVWSQAEVAVLRAYASAISQAVIRARKVRELEEARIVAVQASRAKSEFLANMSHEIRTPLNSVIGFSDLMQHTALDGAQKQYMMAVQHSATLLLDLTNDILDFSKIEAGKFQLVQEEINLPEVLEQITGMMRITADSKKLPLNLTVDPDIPATVTGDQVRLRQVLVNLLSNAIKFTSGGEVELSAHLAGQSGAEARITFSVRDTGIGIPVEKQKAIFDAFTQADSSTTRKYGGTGLGLTISSRLIALMGSTIQLKSEPGSGSTFSFTLTMPLPKVPTVSHVSTPSKPAGHVMSDQAFKLLIADDNEINRLLAKTIIESLLPNASVVETENGNDTVAVFQSFKPDFIVMDIQMPGINGYQAASEIRSLEQHRHVPIVALTAGNTSGEYERCIAAGMDDFVPKPVHMDTFRRLFNRYLLHQP
jgi:PAS domain S-box-containing protein